MKKLLLLSSFIMSMVAAFSQVPQPAVQARRVSALEALTLRDKLIDSLSHDTSLAGNRNTVLSSQAAVKSYIDKRANRDRAVFGSNGLTPINDSTLGILNYHAYPGNREYLGWSDAGAWGLHPFPFNPGGGGGDSSFAISMTYAQFQAATALPTTGVFVYVTDSLRAGYFRYVGAVANQDLDNGGIDIVTADNQRWRRIFPEGGTLYGTWFGLVPNDVGAAASNVIALRTMRNVARTRQVQYIGGGGHTWYFSDSIHYRSTFSWRANVYVGPGNLQFSSPFGIGMEGGFTHDFHYPTGRLIGPNTPPAGRDSAAYAAFADGPSGMFGSGLYIKNTFNSRYTVDEVENWKVGVHMTGEAYGGVGTTALGSQYNKVWYNWIHHNYIQIKIATYGPAGTSGNWNNESEWHGGQLGRGIPGTTYGGGGWFGLVMTKDASSTAVNYGMNGHKFYDYNHEGVEHGFVADFTTNNSFIAPQAEPDGAIWHFNFDPASVVGMKFNGGNVFGDYYFVPGRRGVNTQINDMAFSGKVNTSSGSVTLGYQVQSLKSIAADGMSGYDGIDNAFAIRSIEYPSESALGTAVIDTSHIIISDLARYPTVQMGLQRINGVQRNGAIKKRYKQIFPAQGPVEVLPYNVGHVRYSPDEPTTIQLHPEDIRGNDFEDFFVDITTTHALTVTNFVTGEVLIPAASFTGVGYYHCVYRGGAFKVFKLGGTSTGGGVVMGTTIGAGNDAGAEITNGELILHAANQTQPGIVTTGNQTFSGAKAFDSTKVRVISLFNTGNIKVDIVSRPNGFSVNDVNGTAGSSNAANFTNYNWGSGVGKDIYFSFGKTGVTSVGFGNNGTNLVSATEKTTNGFEWRRGIGFANASLTAGTKLMELFPNGNLLLQFGGTYTDNGNRLQVTGRMNVTDQLYIGQLASDPTTDLANGSMYYNTTTQKFRGYEGGAWVDMIGGSTGTGGGVTGFGTPGAGNANGGSVSGSTAILHYATSTQPGILSTTTQTIAGLKTFSSTLKLRSSTTAAGTSSLDWGTGGSIPTIPENGKSFFNGTYLYLGALNQWQQIATHSNSMVFTNKFWDGARIPVNKGGTPDPVGESGIIKYRNSSIYVEEQNGHLGYHRVYHVTNGANTTYLDVFEDTDIPENSTGMYKLTAIARTTSGNSWRRVWYVAFEKATGTSGSVLGNTEVVPETYDPVAGVDQWDIGVTFNNGGILCQARGYTTANVYWKVIVERVINTGSSPIIKP